jgi:hypothetical protein
MTTREFMDKVFLKFNNGITDEIFYFIETDRELLHDYLHLLQENKLNVLNSNIAKSIKDKYGLKNTSTENK